eukprot:TRINITY_DN1517_c0_g1_i3.p1 TRINITY_DN1517_c0_g1~~TRINITY_DN1517_c0_g1_i3.p1  ORF type:complete len:386 (-),score=46.03 TRINITY_DN1517_c0_g1_i3:116-1273(-)
MIFFQMACLKPFLSVYFKSIDLSYSVIGLLSAISPIAGFFGAPILGSLADKFHAHKLVLLVTYALGVILDFSLMFQTSPTTIAITIVTGSFCSSALTPILDAGIINFLGPEKKALYGFQRLWGSVGWGIASALVGIIAFQTDIRSYFFCALAAGIPTWFLILMFPLGYENNEKTDLPLFPRLYQLFCTQTMPLLSFLFVVFIAGNAYGVISVFLFVVLKDLGGDDILLGISLSTTVSTEIIFFIFSERILNKLGVKITLALSLVTYIVRLVYYGLLSSPWWVLPAELLHGLTFAAMWAACVKHGSDIAPPGLAATMQGIVSGVWSGLGRSFGNILGGQLYSHFGAKWMFMITAAWAAFGLTFFFMSTQLIECLGHRRQKRLEKIF